MTVSLLRTLLVLSAIFGRFDLHGLYDQQVVAADWLASAAPSSSLVAGCDCDDAEEIRSLVSSGKLSSARRKALDIVWESPHCKGDVSRAYVGAFGHSFHERGAAFLQEIQQSANSNDERRIRVLAKRDDANCVKNMAIELDLAQSNMNELWDEACSILSANVGAARSDDLWKSESSTSWEDSKTMLASPVHPCCEFGPDSWAYLRLPALHEPAIRVNIPQRRVLSNERNSETILSLDLEQDGYLRLFDVDGILWPTGYMLSLCLGDVMACPIPELHVLLHLERVRYTAGSSAPYGSIYIRQLPLALELGTGIGAPSIALSKSLQRMGFTSFSTNETNGERNNQHPLVVASDVSPSSLALAMSNAAYNDVGATLSTAHMDYFNQSSVRHLKNQFFRSSSFSGSQRLQTTGFSIVVGSSLQSLFQDTDEEGTLWIVLEELLDMGNPNALVILAHTRSDPLSPPPEHAPFRLIRRISGSSVEFGGMITRAGDSSDFEICVFQPILQNPKRNKAGSIEL